MESIKEPEKSTGRASSSKATKVTVTDRKIGSGRVGRVKKYGPCKPGVPINLFIFQAAALRAIRKYHGFSKLVLGRRPFTRLVREILVGFHSDLQWKWDALKALQESAEAFLVAHFHMLQLCASHANRVTIKEEDNKFVLGLMRKLSG
ncbi:hypothetical protein NHQ30_010868 [Ciborinia camelliae]|nr:hypothetical protein NHQ30_010868 [Ciborinia camelliae]